MTRYELLDRIGVGGMAEIFRGKAVAAGGFEKPVAIKRILPHLSQDRRFVELLIAEAKVLSLLKHRNIVQIFDVGLGDDGQYFLVMEYVDGKDIGAVQRALEQKRRRLPFDLALHIGAEICEALEHAHVSRGPDGKPMALVHRDVSPSNVLLSRAGEVKLTDFGIAKRAESDATQGGAVRGKFAYISPEQARNETLDPRSDVFSVGILMWELCCNRRLFSGLDDLAALRAVREPSVPRPSEIDPRLPPELDQLLLTALARDKKQRFSGCGVLGQKLRSLRYSLEVTVGDPATELAKIIDSTEELERLSKQQIAVAPPGRNDFDAGEATVIRIHTADAFSARDEGKSISQARQVIDKFEEEETRLASVTGDQLRMLRKGAQRDSVEMTAEKPRLDRSAAKRPRRDSGIDDDEMTRMREPIDLGRGKRELYDSPFETPAGATMPGEDSEPGFTPSLDTPPHQHLTPTDNTRLHRRTPLPQQAVRPQRPPTVPPPVPQRSRAATGGPVRPHIPTPQPVPMAQMPQPMPQPLQMAPQSVPQPLQPNLRTPVPQQGLPTGPAMPHVATPMPQQPGLPTPQPGQPLPPHMVQPQFMPSQNAGAYQGGWGPPIAAQMPHRDATPTAQDTYERPVYANRPSMPQVAGFHPRNSSTLRSRGGLKPWVLVVGALIMAALAFAITRAFIG